MSYFGTAINESPVIAIQAGEEIAAPAFLAVTADGKLAKAGVNALGIVTPDCDDKVVVGDDLTVQIKDIGLWLAGAEVAVGDELTPDENGKAKKATDGNFITAIALSAATKADQRVTVQICKCGYKGAAAAGSPAATKLTDLTDVNISGPAADQVLQYDDGEQKWKNKALPSGVKNLNDLEDVEISSPTADQVLKYETDKWKNSAAE